MKAILELEFDLPEDLEDYKMYMQVSDMHSALCKIRDVFRGRAKYQENNCEFHEETYEIICNILNDYKIDI